MFPMPTLNPTRVMRKSNWPFHVSRPSRSIVTGSSTTGGSGDLSGRLIVSDLSLYSGPEIYIKIFLSQKVKFEDFSRLAITFFSKIFFVH